MTFKITAVGLGATSLGTGLYGSISSASQQRKAGKAAAQAAGREQAQAEFEAKQFKEQSIEQARQVRAQAIKAIGTQVATQAASGVMVGDGSTQSIVDEVMSLAEQDAVAYLWDGANNFISMNEKGRLARFEGEQRAKQAFAGATSTLLSGFGNAAGNAAGMGSQIKDMVKPSKK